MSDDKGKDQEEGEGGHVAEAVDYAKVWIFQITFSLLFLRGSGVMTKSIEDMYDHIDTAGSSYVNSIPSWFFENVLIRCPFENVDGVDAETTNNCI